MIFSSFRGLAVRIATVGILAIASSNSSFHSVARAAPVASYYFNNTLAAQEPGAPALTATDPLGQSGFVADTVYGQPRTVYAFTGDNAPADQAGLSLDTTGLLPASNYSAELVFEFFDRDGAWRRVIDVQGRTSDDGFYVDPTNSLDIFPVTGSPQTFSTGEYHHIVLTNDNGTATAYLDGVLQFTTSTNLMDINNVNNLLNLFLDNNVGGFQDEWSNGRIALARFYDTILTADQVAALAANPFATPEPSTITLAAFAVAGLAAFARRRRKH
jgi:MYXO-CTERM domain-containing protein